MRRGRRSRGRARRRPERRAASADRAASSSRPAASAGSIAHTHQSGRLLGPGPGARGARRRRAAPISNSCSSIRPRSIVGPRPDAARQRGGARRRRDPDRRDRRALHGRCAGAELAPRDVVARAVWRAAARPAIAFFSMRAQRSARASPQRFPGIAALCRAAGIDPATQPIPVRPAAHYHMGGIAVDAAGRSSIEGLWACGEAACDRACTAPIASPAIRCSKPLVCARLRRRQRRRHAPAGGAARRGRRPTCRRGRSAVPCARSCRRARRRAARRRGFAPRRSADFAAARRATAQRRSGARRPDDRGRRAAARGKPRRPLRAAISRRTTRRRRAPRLTLDRRRGLRAPRTRISPLPSPRSDRDEPIAAAAARSCSSRWCAPRCSKISAAPAIITTDAIVPPDADARDGAGRAQAGVVAGLDLAALAFRADRSARSTLRSRAPDGAGSRRATTSPPSPGRRAAS